MIKRRLFRLPDFSCDNWPPVNQERTLAPEFPIGPLSLKKETMKPCSMSANRSCGRCFIITSPETTTLPPSSANRFNQGTSSDFFNNFHMSGTGHNYGFLPVDVFRLLIEGWSIMPSIRDAPVESSRTGFSGVPIAHPKIAIYKTRCLRTATADEVALSKELRSSR